MKRINPDHITSVIWDWNGTLLDDVDACLDCINILLSDRGKPPLGPERYKEIFTFPVKEYYIKAGFDFTSEPFEIPAHQFIDLYRDHIRKSPLQKSALKALAFMEKEGYQQAILSAMQQDLLYKTLSDNKIDHYFTYIRGINNHLGAGKTEIASLLLDDIGLPADQICLIGDTIHDFEVSSEIGVNCILVASGHQSRRRLEMTGCEVVDSLEDLINIFGKNDRG